MGSRRIFVEKKPAFRVEAESLRREFNENLSLDIRSLRLVNMYDLSGFSDSLLEQCRYTVFGERVSDTVVDSLDLAGRRYLAVEYIPGQFDQRASSALDCVHLIDPAAQVEIRSGRLLIFDDDFSETGLEAVRRYFINAVESREKDLSVIAGTEAAAVRPLAVLDGFTEMEEKDFAAFCRSWGLAMNTDDLRQVVLHFRGEGRNPTETELRILDTYWSDHCRHTTFTTHLTDIRVEDSFIRPALEADLRRLDEIRHELGRDAKPLCLMELATIGARYLKHKGVLDNQEQSEENNACSIVIDVDVNGNNEKWLLQFKNETHNHPTEIEPFGGAATCLGGAIRDPLSGRAYVYQAMRVTGAGDIWKPVSETMHGKLPQRMISRKAAAGYSSYGNQIGLATTHVREIFHPGYTAKRMEVGAVVGAVPVAQVVRERPQPGDVILLLGGRTGRDGIGGATGSSKGHTDASLTTCGSEVQKGNAPEERKLQRLFRRPDASHMIKKSNDFGAGGVSVAIGELADGLEIHLDRVPTKYSGLNAMELSISESQERMAVVIAAADRSAFEECCAQENIEVTYVADVTGSGRMQIFNGADLVADLPRSFIDSAGARHYAKATILPVTDCDPFTISVEGDTTGQRLRNLLAKPNVLSQKGLIEMFDSTIGSSTVLMPFGGRWQDTETQVSVQKLPVSGETDTASMMAFGYNPDLATWSPYHSAAYAVVEACTKVAAAGGDWSTMRFSYQEYFERMTSDPHTWGKPLSALLGALRMQVELGLPSIGGKDSMSGTFEQIHVPPTLIAFGITPVKASRVISPEFKHAGNRIYLLRHIPLADHMPDTDALKQLWSYVHRQIESGIVVSAWSLGFGGAGEGLAKMAFGNRLGFDVQLPEDDLYRLGYGSILVESTGELDALFALPIGRVTDGADGCVSLNGERMELSALRDACYSRFDEVYPEKTPCPADPVPEFAGCSCSEPAPSYPGEAIENPLVLLPVFPGTNCDYDTAAAFRAAGAHVRFSVFRNLTEQDVLDSIEALCRDLDECQILALSGGFSSGDEPDGSGKFIANVLGNPKVAARVEALLRRKGLVLGICNGFQALVKSGLLPDGRLGVSEDDPTLFRNDINRHISQLVTTVVSTTRSPWLSGFKAGELHTVAVSHGEGKFVVNPGQARQLFENGQVAFRYADPATGMPTMESPFNPNGSSFAIEGVISPDGLVLGKMGHSERAGRDLYRNIPSPVGESIFTNAVNYFRKA
ncbi:MAG: phosphoribosylformylglycinamidine synthase [Bacteroidales bacterium]|nr:phosphoribosylformylglycinamidine synthase [Bacteroidales bacterium]MBR0499425.1 phosphoribosylformylglycinamidine synthase [Bacteroidales bacterium]